MVRMCTALTAQNRKECMRPVVESAEISLCALHLILAKSEAEKIGIARLATIVRTSANSE